MSPELGRLLIGGGQVPSPLCLYFLICITETHHMEGDVSFKGVMQIKHVEWCLGHTKCSIKVAALYYTSSEGFCLHCPCAVSTVLPAGQGVRESHSLTSCAGSHAERSAPVCALRTHTHPNLAHRASMECHVHAPSACKQEPGPWPRAPWWEVLTPSQCSTSSLSLWLKVAGNLGFFLGTPPGPGLPQGF